MSFKETSFTTKSFNHISAECHSLVLHCFTKTIKRTRNLSTKQFYWSAYPC